MIAIVLLKSQYDRILVSWRRSSVPVSVRL